MVRHATRFLRDSYASIVAQHTSHPLRHQVGKLVGGVLVDNVLVPAVRAGVNKLSGVFKRPNPGRVAVEMVRRYKRNARRYTNRRRRSTKRVRPNRQSRRTLSQYHENATDYVRKRRRRRSQSFGKRVMRAIISESPTWQITRQAVGSVTWLAGKQNYFGSMMYQVATSSTGALGPTMKAGADSDILKMFDFLNTTLAAPAVASTFQASKLFVKMAYLEFYVTNTTATSQIELDCYEICARKIYQAQAAIDTAFTNLFTQTPNATGATTSATDPAVTVFQNNGFCKHFTVLKRTSHLIEPNKTVRFEMSSNKCFMYEGSDLQDAGLCLKRARGFFFIVKTMPASGTFPAGSVSWGYTKRYRFQQPPSYGTTDLLADL